MFILTHISFAILLSFWTGLPLLPLLVTSILSDIDSPRTFIGKLFNPLSYWLHKNFGHRTITHSWIPLSILGIFYLMARDNFSLSLLLGYSSYIFLDLLNTSGVMLFYPKKLYFTLTDLQISTFKKYDFLLCLAFILLSWWIFLMR